MTDLLSKRDLKKLPLRATIALSLRATKRVASFILYSSKAASAVSDVRIFNISLLLAESFCNGILHGESTRLAHIMEGTKWDPKEESIQSDDPVMISGNNIFSACMHAQFGHSVEPGLPTFSTANKVIDLAYHSIAAAFEASFIAGERYRSCFLEEVWHDYEFLFEQSTALFPAYGQPVDLTAMEPLGTLWGQNTPHQIPPGDLETEASSSSKVQGEVLDITGHSTRACNAAPENSLPRKSTADASLEEGYLYKYVSFESLQNILEDSTLRFSPVSVFNDPFDGQLLPISKFGWEQFFNTLREEVARLITTADESIVQLPSDVPIEDVVSVAAQLVKESLHCKKDVTLSPEFSDKSEKVQPLSNILRPLIFLAQQGQLGSNQEALQKLNGLLDLFKNHRISFSISDGDRRLIPAMADIIQVLCLSGVCDSLLMWAHYAEQHKGAVLKFDLRSESSDFFTMARPVNYEKELPGIEQPLSQVQRFLGLPVDTNDWLSRQFFVKSEEWAYEKEWRVMATAEMRKQGEYISFHSGSLAAIYLGCRMEAPQIRSVMNLVIDKQYPTDIFIAIKDDAEFALSFSPLINGRARTQKTTPNMSVSERESLYRWCLDAYFDFWNDPSDREPNGVRRQLRREGALVDYGPPNSIGLFRKMMQTLHDTADGAEISADKEKEPEEHHKQYIKLLKPSANAYGTFEDILKDDLASRGGTLPEHQESPDDDSEMDTSRE